MKDTQIDEKTTKPNIWRPRKTKEYRYQTHCGFR